MTSLQEGDSPWTGPRGKLLVEIKEAQKECGCVPREFMQAIAERLNISIGEVYGVTTFYSFLSTQPRGRNIIRVCGSLPCYLKNSQMIIESIRDAVGISPGENTKDGRFSLEMTNCIGACDKAPAMMINDEVYGDLSPNRIADILRSYE